MPADAPVISAVQPSIFISSHIHEQCQRYCAYDSANVTGHADTGKQRNRESGHEHDPKPRFQSRLSIPAIGKDQCCAKQTEDAAGRTDRGAFFWMPIVHEENYGGRAEHADKIDQCASSCSDLLFNNSTDPEKQSDIEKQVQPIEMEKRIGGDTPEFTAQLAIVRQRTEFQERVVISNTVRRDLNSKANGYRENQDERSAIFVELHLCASMNFVGSSHPRVSSR